MAFVHARVGCELAAVRAKRDAEITRKLDELFADERLTKTQRRGAAVLDRVGTNWTDERW